MKINFSKKKTKRLHFYLEECFNRINLQYKNSLDAESYKINK